MPGPSPLLAAALCVLCACADVPSTPVSSTPPRAAVPLPPSPEPWTRAPTASVTPESYGARGDGVHDDSGALAAFIAALGPGRPGALRPGAVYALRRGDGSVLLALERSGVRLYGQGATLRVMDGTDVARPFFVLRIAAADVWIGDVTLDGNRARRPVLVDSTAQVGLLVDAGAERVTVERVTVVDFPLDGVYVRGMTELADGRTPVPRDVVVQGADVSGSGRNNISVISSDGLTIRGGRVDGAGGVPGGPWAGIDVEPNPGIDVEGNRHLLIEGVSARGNAGAAVAVAQGPNTDITVRGLRAEANGAALFAAPSGTLTVEDLVARDYAEVSAAGVVALVPSGVDGHRVALRGLVIEDVRGPRPALFQNYVGDVVIEGAALRAVRARPAAGVYAPARVSGLTLDDAPYTP